MTPATRQLTRGAVEVHVPPHALVAPRPAPDTTRPGPAATRIVAVVPCYNRPDDLALLLRDLAASRHTGIDLSVLVVDNASDRALADTPTPPSLAVRTLRLDSNTGGSGGFNAGIARALADGAASNSLPDFLWLVDSDARVQPDTLRHLATPMLADPAIAAAGAAIADPRTGEVFELGGRVNRRNGKFEPVCRGRAGAPALVECDYVAACCALVRTSAVLQAGLMPDVFLNADDVEWFIRLARATGGRIVAVRDALAAHPTFDRFPTWARYYIARNAFGPIQSLRLGPLARARRALREVARSAGQRLMGRSDLAELHLRGLADAGLTGPAREPLEFEAFHPFRLLAAHAESLRIPRRAQVRVAVEPHLGVPSAVRDEILAQVALLARDGRTVSPVRARPLWLRLLIGPGAHVAITPARGRPRSWLTGRGVIAVTPQGFVAVRVPPVRTSLAAARVVLRGLAHTTRLTRREPDPVAAPIPPLTGLPRPSLGVVVVSYKRAAAVVRTLETLTGPCGLDPACLIVVDNASADGTADAVRAGHPGVEIIELAHNTGVEAFNTGAAALLAREKAPAAILVLDDDAAPDPAALAAALDLMAARPDVAAVALHPKHPKTGQSEWRFGVNAQPQDRWPVMGCGNLVRSAAWQRVGGYEPSLFLYRNDTDLALKLLGAGLLVHFNPQWVVWHDSQATRRKSPRWHQLATRNWIWVARRHARGGPRLAAITLGWLWAHALAGLSPSRHWATLKGLIHGLATPPRPAEIADNGRGLAALLRMQLRSRSGAQPGETTRPAQ
ncbi:MAG: glycosyltransferase family 2 protein [Phycisphaeraceae bacterium]|nr:glycosyltransferase family 2 protein [Phycisphaeraceae bacterium]